MYSTNHIIRTISLIALTLGCFGLSPHARAACQQGCDISNNNTFLGENALLGSGGFNNTAIGNNALSSNTFGQSNTANGSFVLRNNTTGSNNTATGEESLSSNTTGTDNTANGFYALLRNTTGINNTANGSEALFTNTTGSRNTANGFSALFSNTTGGNNTASGYNALYFNSTGSNNTGNGRGALYHNTTASNNTAAGYQALVNNTTGHDNLAAGVQALYSNISASNGTASGNYALFNNTTGSSNTALGNDALLRNTTGSNNVALGVSAGTNLTTGSNNIDIAALGAAGESNTIRLGKAGVQTATYIIGIRGATVAGGVSVMVDSVGHLGTITSSARYKEVIKPMDKASEAILALQPVTFRYKKALDPDSIPQFGLIAEQVEKVDPDLVARDEQGKPYTVRYEAVNAMLLNEFLKEHRKGQQQDRKIDELEATVVQLQSALKAQAAQIQNVSEQIKAQALAPRVVANN